MPKKSAQLFEDLDHTDQPEDGEAPHATARRGGAPWTARTTLGYDLDVTISALQKNIRRGREREALFWAHELWTSYPAYFWRRMMIIASEECASDPMAILMTNACYQNAMVASKQGAGRIEGLIEAHAVLYLARAVKSREACDAAMSVQAAKNNGWRIDPHDSAVDKHTRRGKSMGRGAKFFETVGRLVAGKLGRNDYETTNWPDGRQPYLPRPEEKGGEPDVVVPVVPRDRH